MERTCHLCKLSKPLTDFVNDKTKNGGKGYRCVPCNRALSAAQNKKVFHCEVCDLDVKRKSEHVKTWYHSCNQIEFNQRAKAQSAASTSS